MAVFESVMHIFINRICTAAIPLFFIISGYLFFVVTAVLNGGC